jgi:HSP20 family molecular chaperone IbpA
MRLAKGELTSETYSELIIILSQLPTNNKKENIKVIVYNLLSELKGDDLLVIPYEIDFGTARSTYRNGILEITFD